jgi:predicted nuclease of predicted toxin-antitoxin system
VTTGNITNDALIELVGAGLAAITHAFESSDLVELGQDALIVHKRRVD